MTVATYVDLARDRGVVRLSAAFLMTGLAGTMTPVAFVLFVRDASGSFATASLVLGAFTTGGILTAPGRGRLVDRRGPRRALLTLAVPSAATDLALILAGRVAAAGVVLVVCGLLCGATSPPVAAALRSVWAERVDDDHREAGYALMTALGEVAFFGGPLVAGLLIAVGSSTAAVAGAAALTLCGTLAFATSRDAARRGTGGVSTRLGALSGTRTRTVIATAALFGLTFGTLDVAFVVVGRSQGSGALAGVLLSAVAVGIGVGSLAYGARPHTRSAVARYPGLCALAAVGLAPLLLMPPLLLAVLLAGVAGLGFAPISVCQNAAIAEVVDPSSRAEAFSWLATAYGAGAAVGAAFAGQLADADRLRAAFALAFAATASAWLVSTVRLREPKA